MNRKEFGELLKALRREHIDIEDADKPWSQQKLAEKSRLTEIMIGTIERGTKSNLEPETLLQLAEALGLTSNERKEFFAAASGISHQNTLRLYSDPQTCVSEMRNFLHAIVSPAFLMDSYGDIVALNRACVILLDADLISFRQASEKSVTNFNLMTVVFSPEFEQQRTKMQECISAQEYYEFLWNSVIFFRTLTFKHRSTKYFEHILIQMRKHYPLFRRFWSEVYSGYKDNYIDNIYLRLNHSQFGRLAMLGCTVTAVTTVGDLKLISLSPLSFNTSEVFKQVLETMNGQVVEELLPRWPQKRFGV